MYSRNYCKISCILKLNICEFLALTIGHINASSSLFSYSHGMGPSNYSDPSFIPNFSKDINKIFGNNTQIRDEAIKLCNGDANCLFDAAETLSISIAVTSKNTSKAIATTQTDISKFFALICYTSVNSTTCYRD